MNTSCNNTYNIVISSYYIWMLIYERIHAGQNILISKRIM